VVTAAYGIVLSSSVVIAAPERREPTPTKPGYCFLIRLNQAIELPHLICLPNTGWKTALTAFPEALTAMMQFPEEIHRLIENLFEVFPEVKTITITADPASEGRYILAVDQGDPLSIEDIDAVLTSLHRKLDRTSSLVY